MEDRTRLLWRLLDAMRRLVARSGMEAAAFRAIAREAEVSPGLVAHQFGTLDQLVEALIAAETRDMEQWLQAWRARMGAPAQMPPAHLSWWLTALLDDWVWNRRGSAFLQAHLLVAPPEAPGPRTAVAAMAETLCRGLERMLAGRVPDVELVAPLLAGVLSDERPFSLAIGQVPAYRLLRELSLGQLLGGMPAGMPPAFLPCCAELERMSATADTQAPASDSRAGTIAEAIADLLESGAPAISHRRVGARAGLPHSTIAHHYPTTDSLLRGGFAALYRRIRNPAVAEPGEVRLRRVARSSHGLALAATRDPMLLPYAVDMRWRRGENLRPYMARILNDGAPPDSHWMSAHAFAVAGIGLAALLVAPTARSPADTLYGAVAALSGKDIIRLS